MANNVLHQLRNIFGGSCSFAQKASKLSLLKDHCEEIINLATEKAKADRVILPLCQFAKFQFPNSQESRCLDHYPVRLLVMFMNM